MYIINQRCLIGFYLLSISQVFPNATKLEISFCGFEQSCSRDSPKLNLSLEACCRPCECDGICREKGTCCRDIKVTDKYSDVTQKCLFSAYAPEGVPVPPGILSYYNRVSCPKTYNDTNIKARCEEDMHETLADVRPVSSSDGKLLYKNKYCSYCNGEKHVNSWKVFVVKSSPFSCRGILSGDDLNVQSITSKVLTNCILGFTPPRNIAFWNFLCFKEHFVVKQCNITGKWNTFDNELNNLCINQTDTGYYIFRNPSRVYNNVYCSLCNGLSYDSVDACKNIFERLSFAVKPYIKLVNVNKLLDQDMSTVVKSRCGNGEIFDTFFKKCRTLYCFWRSLSFKGRCLPFLDIKENVGYTLTVKIVPLTKDIKQTEITNPDLRNLYVRIQEKLDFLHCYICTLFILTDKGSPEDVLQNIYIRYVITSTTRCKEEDIWSRFMEIETKLPFSFTLTINKTDVLFKASWNETLSLYVYQWDVLLIAGEAGTCKQILPSRGMFCPKVKLLKHEAELVMKHHRRSEELIWVKNRENFNDSVFLCSYKYISNSSCFGFLKYDLWILIVFTILCLKFRLK